MVCWGLISVSDVKIMTGLTIKNAAGQVLVDMTMFISQTQGAVDTGATNGGITIPAPPAGKTQFFIVVPLVNMGNTGKLPGVTLSVSNLTWAYLYPTNGWGFFSANARIYYGYY
jgi:hypothetical protein